MPILRVLRGPGTTKSFRLVDLGPKSGHVATIGRDERLCEICLTPRTISREHARITKDGDAHFLEDLNSKAGTLLNGRRLKPNTPCRLRGNDLIKVCEFLLTFREDSAKLGSQANSSRSEPQGRQQDLGFMTIPGASSSTWERWASVNAEGKLTALIRLIHELRSVVALDDVLVKVLDSLLAMFAQTDTGIVVLTLRESAPQRVAAKHRDSPVDERPTVASDLLEEVLSLRAPVIASDNLTICVPLLDRNNQLLGAIQLDCTGGGQPFTHDDLELLATVAFQVSFAVENALLHETALREGVFELELRIAHDIQGSLLPDAPPEVPEYAFNEYYHPARYVGGDYFDYLPLPHGRVALILGDVSGKGVPAALLMAKVSSELGVYLSSGLEPVEVMNRVNARFEARSPEGAFVTMVLAVLDPHEHHVTIVNAGHLLPMLRRRDGTVDQIGREVSRLPLGVLPDVEYQSIVVPLGAGETMLMVTDGVTEAQDAAGEIFGTARLRDHFARAEGDCVDIVERIVEAIGDFAADREQSDDICVLCLRRNS